MSKPDHFPFVYQATVCFWDEDTRSNKRYRIAGLGFCSSYTDAVAQIEKREGKELEAIEHIEIIGERDDSIIEISPKWVESFIHTTPESMMQRIDSKGRVKGDDSTPCLK